MRTILFCDLVRDSQKKWTLRRVMQASNSAKRAAVFFVETAKCSRRGPPDFRDRPHAGGGPLAGCAALTASLRRLLSVGGLKLTKVARDIIFKLHSAQPCPP